MSMISKGNAVELIRRNIARHGHHIYVVTGGAVPRFAYTIGLSQSCGIELIFAGGATYTIDEVKLVVNHLSSVLRSEHGKKQLTVEVASLGLFSLHEVEASWVKSMMLGALDFYSSDDLLVLQVVPDEQHWTIDVPNMTRPLVNAFEPVWQWLYAPWNYPIPMHSVAATNLGALRGQRVTEVARWEEDQWEMFAGSGPDVAPTDVRVVPMGTLLGFDKSLISAAKLSIGSAIWRDAAGVPEWHVWEAPSQ